MTALPTLVGARQMLDARRATFALLFFLHGCATIFSGRTQDIELRSEPASTIVTAQPGGHHATTPATLTLPRLESGYRLRFEKPGYEPQDVRLTSSRNGWVWANILLGGLIGLAVDYSTGAAYTLSPDEVDARMTPLQAPISANPAR